MNIKVLNFTNPSTNQNSNFNSCWASFNLAPNIFSWNKQKKKKPGFVEEIQMTNLIVKLSQEDANFWLFCEAEEL